MVVEYVNGETGEVVSDRREAIEWYRAGDSVTIYRDGKPAITWVH